MVRVPLQGESIALHKGQDQGLYIRQGPLDHVEEKQGLFPIYQKHSIVHSVMPEDFCRTHY